MYGRTLAEWANRTAKVLGAEAALAEIQGLKGLLETFHSKEKGSGVKFGSFQTQDDFRRYMAEDAVKVPDDPDAADLYRRLFLNNRRRGLEIVFDSARWAVGIPRTKESSVAFGKDANWCTAQATRNMYERYTDRGPLYIVLDKASGELFQFQFQYREFRDAGDYLAAPD